MLLAIIASVSRNNLDFHMSWNLIGVRVIYCLYYLDLEFFIIQNIFKKASGNLFYNQDIFSK